jgi:hypothetical protein
LDEASETGKANISTDSMFDGIYDENRLMLNDYAKKFAPQEEIDDDMVYWDDYKQEIESDLLEWKNDIVSLIILNFNIIGYDTHTFGELIAFDGKYITVEANMMITKKYVLDEVMSFGEACQKYGLDNSTIRKNVEYEKDKPVDERRIKPWEIRKSGRDWLITKEAAKRIYG